jgi:hypothetical protein
VDKYRTLSKSLYLLDYCMYMLSRMKRERIWKTMRVEMKMRMTLNAFVGLASLGKTPLSPSGAVAKTPA